MVGVLCGVASAVFLHLLERATATRGQHPHLVFVLPLAGVLLGFVLERWGAPMTGGSDRVLDALHEGTTTLAARTTPIVLLGTVFTHLFGGSAGREGTAVQMGASLADTVARRLHVDAAARRTMLFAGIAGGFGSVFGTPLAGAVFAMEVVTVGRLERRAFLPALVAAVVGDAVTSRLGVVHTPYPAFPPLALDVTVVARLAVVGVAMAAAAVAFVELRSLVTKLAIVRLPRLPVRGFVGGLVVVGLWQVAGSEYLGLGIPTILRAFTDPSLATPTFAWKILFTAVTLAAGFVGGEVTPLFFVGATLGSVLARLLGLPIAVGAGVGLAAVFGAASKAPLALTLMAVEILGLRALPSVFLVTVVAYLLSGPRGIYTSQRRARRSMLSLGPARRRPSRAPAASGGPPDPS